MKVDFRNRLPLETTGIHDPRRAAARRVRLLGAGLLMALSIAACATFHQETPAERAQRIDAVLVAAGFHPVTADSPKKQSIFASLAPLQMHY